MEPAPPSTWHTWQCYAQILGFIIIIFATVLIFIIEHPWWNNWYTYLFVETTLPPPWCRCDNHTHLYHYPFSSTESTEVPTPPPPTTTTETTSTTTTTTMTPV